MQDRSKQRCGVQGQQLAPRPPQISYLYIRICKLNILFFHCDLNARRRAPAPRVPGVHLPRTMRNQGLVSFVPSPPLVCACACAYLCTRDTPANEMRAAKGSKKNAPHTAPGRLSLHMTTPRPSLAQIQKNVKLCPGRLSHKSLSYGQKQTTPRPSLAQIQKNVKLCPGRLSHKSLKYGQWGWGGRQRREAVFEVRAGRGWRGWGEAEMQGETGTGCKLKRNRRNRVGTGMGYGYGYEGDPSQS